MSGWVCAINTGSERLVKDMVKSLAGANGSATKTRVLNSDGMIVGVSEGLGPRVDPKPLDLADGATVVIFQGSVSNAASLRPHLKPKPVEGNDSGIVLSLYKMRGRKCVHYLEGAFALVLKDGDRFYAARDPLGICPLYYAKTAGGWLFATELKAFAKKPSGVNEFPPGCYFESDVGARRYFKLPDATAEKVNVQDAVEVVRVLVTEAVQRAQKADAEVGLYLTGSVESCIIAALASQKNRRIKTFSVGLEGSNDGQTARKVASWLGTDHVHREVTEQEILDNLQQIVFHLESFDAPLVRHAVADYFAVQEAAKHVQILMSGDVANELFGGYPYLRPMYHEKLTAEIKAITENLHRTQLQRWYRMTSVHGVEGRLPFAERRLVHTVSRLPANLKVSEDGRSKWALRRAFSTMLPAWVVDRPDSDDVHFTGIQHMLGSYAETCFTEEDLQAHREAAKEEQAEIRTKDEMLYYQIWSAKFPHEFVKLVGRTHL